MGGGAALWMSINEAERIEKVVPVGTFGIATQAPYHKLSWVLTELPLNEWSYALMKRFPILLGAALRQIFLDPEKLTPELSAEVLDVLQDGANGRAFSQFQRGEMRWERLSSVFTDQLPNMTHPTLFIHGAGDTLVPAADVERMANRMQSASFELMQASHWPMRECPKEFNSLVLSFL